MVYGEIVILGVHLVPACRDIMCVLLSGVYMLIVRTQVAAAELACIIMPSVRASLYLVAAGGIRYKSRTRFASPTALQCERRRSSS